MESTEENETKEFKCKSCNEEFEDESKLKLHSMTHETEREDSNQSDSQKECRRFSLKQKPFRCNVCNYSCWLKRKLDLHQQIHTGNVPSTSEEISKECKGKICICKFCKKKFKENSGLMTHLKTHAEEIACICEKCGKNFIQKIYLDKEEKMDLTGKQLRCKNCISVFIKKDEKVKNNKKIHKKYLQKYFKNR
ncbi:zinc finger protein 260-like [Centruroides vittatus]|uniref:zinc finger protein 260-like n=1 Tax=Centruroides vittatus TaxID=120091 RepID=UPI00351022FB